MTHSLTLDDWDSDGVPKKVDCHCERGADHHQLDGVDDALVWAVTVSNYSPPEVVAIYDNEAAARRHADADRSDLGLTVIAWQVASEYEGPA